MISSIYFQRESMTESKWGRGKGEIESVQTWQIVNEGMNKYFCTIVSILLYVKKFENINSGEISPSK